MSIPRRPWNILATGLVAIAMVAIPLPSATAADTAPTVTSVVDRHGEGFRAAWDTLKGAAYSTRLFARYGFHTTATDYTLIDGAPRRDKTIEAWMTDDGFDGGVTVHETYYRSGVEDGQYRYGSMQRTTSNGPRPLTGWFSIDQGDVGTDPRSADARVMARIPDRIRYVSGPVPGEASSMFLPEQVAERLHDDGAVPWNAEDPLSLCEWDSELFAADCDGTVTDDTVTGGRAWEFHITTTEDGLPARQYTVQARSDRFGFLTWRSVTTTPPDGNIAWRTVTRAHHIGQPQQLPRGPRLSRDTTMSSKEFTRVVAEVVVGILAGHVKKTVRAELRHMNAALTPANLTRAVNRISTRDTNWWAANDAYSAWNSAIGWGWDSISDTYRVSTSVNDGLTGVDLDAVITVTDGRFQVRYDTEPLR